MVECNYWWDDDSTQWCDMTGIACQCKGDSTQCTIHGKSIPAALREEQKTLMRDNMIKCKKRRIADAN